MRTSGSRPGPGRLAAVVVWLAVMTWAPLAAQGHFPPDAAIQEMARQTGTVSGKVGIVIGLLEADGTRRVITVGDAQYDGRTLFEIGSITKVFTGILFAEMAARGEVLGHALALRAGSSYEALVTARNLEPLGLTSTGITLSPADAARLAPGHDARGRQVPNWDLADAFAGAGGLRSSTDDMLTFLAANLAPPEGSTLGRAIRSAQTAHFTGADGRGGGLGWGRSLLRGERHILTHAGGTGGYLTFVAVDPGRRLGVVVLSNQVPDVARLGLHLLDARVPVSLAPVERPFTILPVLLGLLLAAGVFVAWRRTGGSVRQSVAAAFGMLSGVAGWMVATYLAAASRLLQFPPGPPTMVVLFVLILVLSVGLGVSAVGRRLALGLPLAVLVGAQGFRLPLELMMHRAYEYGLMPVQMSYSGLNYDIVTGITALIVAALVATGRAGVRTVRAWNVLGTLLLVNIIVIAFLSAPAPWRVFMTQPANVWITSAPYVWLPAVMVAFAILGHIVIYRRLRASRYTIRPADRHTTRPTPDDSSPASLP